MKSVFLLFIYASIDDSTAAIDHVLAIVTGWVVEQSVAEGSSIYPSVHTTPDHPSVYVNEAEISNLSAISHVHSITQIPDIVVTFHTCSTTISVAYISHTHVCTPHVPTFIHTWSVVVHSTYVGFSHITSTSLQT
jgi:hypothetical protein